MNFKKIQDIADLSNNRVTRFIGNKKYVNTGCVIDNKIVDFELVDYENKPSRADLIADDNNVLFARMMNTIKVIISNKEIQKDFIFSTGFAILKPKDNIYSYFLSHYLKSKYFNREKDKLCSGATQKAIRNDEIENIYIPIPSLIEQKNIASILDKMEETIIKRKNSIRFLDELMKSVFYEMFGDIEKNTKKWDVVTLKELSEQIVDCPHSTPSHSTEPTEFPCIRTSEILKGYIDWTSMKYLTKEEYVIRIKRLKPIEGDVIYGREGTFGDAIRIPPKTKISLGQRVMLFRPDKKVTNSIFLWMLLRSNSIYNQAKKKTAGSTVGHINVKDIIQFKGVCPPLSIQNDFANFVINIELTKSIMEESLKEIENLFNSLMQKYFSN